MRSVDLFSGIGGMTYALRGIATPLLYCDIDPFCQRVLKKNMKKGYLPSARIHSDVATLSPETIQRSGHAVDLIVAGFPCTGFSQIGGMAGFDNPGSVLFQHVVRLTQAWRPPFVFMENVPPILSMGMPALTEAFIGMGYDLRWCLCSGKDVGAPHERRRWFCLAIRQSVPEELKRVSLTRGYSFHGWNAEPVARMVAELKKFDHKRCGALGNAVIPHAVRTAFVYLFTGMPHTFDLRDVNQAQNSTLVLQTMMQPGSDRRMCRSLLKKYPRQGYLSGQHSDVVWARELHIIRPDDLIRDRQLVFDPSVYTPPADVPPSPKRTMPMLDAPKRKPLWSTPRFSCTTSSHVSTERNIRDLPTQLRFERGTPSALRSGWANPEFIEWMMGFPIQWTRIRTSLALDSEDESGEEGGTV